MSLRFVFASALLLLGCEPVLSAQTLKLVPLPPDVQTGPALAGVQTKEGRIFAAPVTGGLLRLTADAGAWDVLPAPVLQRFLPDFKEGLSLALGENDTGLFRASGDHFVGFTPAVPALSDPSFSVVGWNGLIGRDATDVLWASAAPTLGTSVFLAHLDPGASDWSYDEVPVALLPRQAVPAERPVMTSDARFFYRPAMAGLWELDLANHALVERVACDHPLFRASRTNTTPCQDNTLVFAGRGGQLFLFTPNHELWRLDAHGTTPSLVVKGDLPKLEVVVDRNPAEPHAWVDPKNRVWLSFRWGTNVDSDTSWLYVAEPGKHDSWTFLKGDLPRSVLLFGDGPTPLISSASQNTGLLLFRIAE